MATESLFASLALHGHDWKVFGLIWLFIVLGLGLAAFYAWSSTP